MPSRSHIFISYATEQAIFCDWLARQLAVAGYSVWYDRLKLLGGEEWPRSIDIAIKERSCRMLALLSRDSMRKSNPQAEWTTGRNVGSELGISDFVIPINVDGISPNEIVWNFQNTQYIPFHPNWATGLAKLLETLTTAGVPKNLPDGSALSVSTITSGSATIDEPELLMSNCFKIEQIPIYIRRYMTSRNLALPMRRKLHDDWACRDISPNAILAFEDPPHEVREELSLQFTDQVAWRDKTTVYGIETHKLVAGLIYRCIDQILIRNEFLRIESKRRKIWCLNSQIPSHNRISFRYPNGSKSWFRGVGERTYPTINGKEIYRYHLNPSISVKSIGNTPHEIIMRMHVHLTDRYSRPLKNQQILSRRKHLCKFWFNREWSARILGIAQLLADEDLRIRHGQNGPQQLIINATPELVEVHRTINDEALEADE